MELTQFYILLGTTAGLFITALGSTLGLFLWVRSEANADREAHRSEAAADRRDILHLIRSIEQEMKDFHGRLCAIEEKYRSK